MKGTYIRVLNNRLLEELEKIKAAREYGDLSENAEYEEAKNEQAFLEGKILELSRKMSGNELTEKLVALAKDAGGGDNITVVVLEDQAG